MIEFKTVRWKNLLSYGNTWTEIQLNRSPTTLIQGKNGSGKSALLDAICWALFGKPFRKINKPQLVNYRNKKDLIVEIEFGIGDVEWKVIRGASPGIFEIYRDGELINQNAANKDYQKFLEDNVLKIDFNTFNQIVILGKATHTSFMKLSAGDRRKFIETILGLNIFGIMNDVHKQRVSQLKEDLSDIKNGLVISRDKIEVRTKYIDDLKNDASKKKQEIDNILNAQISKLIEEIEKLQSDIISLEVKLNPIDSDEQKSLNIKLQQISQLISKSSLKSKQIVTNINFFKDNDICPTCNQNITLEIKDGMIESLGSKKGEVDDIVTNLQNKYMAISEQVNSIIRWAEANQAIYKDVHSLQQVIKDKNKTIRKLESDKDQDVTVDTSKIDSEVELLAQLQFAYEDLLDQRTNMAELFDYYDLITGMLKDTGIKNNIIRKYIPLINNIVNHNLKLMGFFVKFILDDDFEERFLSRGIDDMSYFNYSEGEKLRIDLAILMAWREVVKLQNNMHTNLLIFDEIFDSALDQAGVDAFIDILSTSKQINVFVVSHTPDKLIDKFRSNIMFDKVGGFSVMKTMS